MVNDLVGKTIGVFDIIRDSGKRTPSGNVLWEVKCHVCGYNKLLPRQKFTIYQSCGCISRDLLSISLRKSLNRGGCGEIYATHWNGIRKNAISRKLKFDIDVKYAWRLFLDQDRKCKLTGVPIQFSKRCWSKDATASLDRIDSTKGYIKGNVQWVHKEVNMMKQQYETEKFFNWCKKVVEYNQL